METATALSHLTPGDEQKPAYLLGLASLCFAAGCLLPFSPICNTRETEWGRIRVDHKDLGFHGKAAAGQQMREALASPRKPKGELLVLSVCCLVLAYQRRWERLTKTLGSDRQLSSSDRTSRDGNVN